jgi:hypothetical protein
MSSIKPKNVTAQLQYRGAGNPPQTHPISAVGNYFPGLEFNFLNVWKRLFVGIDLLETGGEVLSVDPDQPPNIQALQGLTLVAVDGKPTLAKVTGPAQLGGPDVWLGPPGAENNIFFEWTNVLSDVHAVKGGTALTADCKFQLRGLGPDGKPQYVTIPFKVRRLIEADSALISREASLPGELTESLCSPWQTDYIGCACYYWAANRPDYVNIQKSGNVSVGHNWLNLSRVRSGNGNPFYTLRPENNLRHEDVLQGWEHKFHFVIAGKDAVDGAVPSDEETPTS